MFKLIHERVKRLQKDIQALHSIMFKLIPFNLHKIVYWLPALHSIMFKLIHLVIMFKQWSKNLYIPLCLN